MVTERLMLPSDRSDVARRPTDGQASAVTRVVLEPVPDPNGLHREAAELLRKHGERAVEVVEQDLSVRLLSGAPGVARLIALLSILQGGSADPSQPQ
jgi:hypothetical protein